MNQLEIYSKAIIKKFMRILLGLMVVYFMLAVFGQIAMANDNAKQSQVAQIQASWVVEEITRENGFPTGECAMRATYDNNIEVTFKGKKGQLSAMRVRDMNGSKGSEIKGFLSFVLDRNSYGLQSRSVSGQIDASLLTVPAAADKIMNLNSFGIRVSGKRHMFSADGFAYAYHDLLKCTGYENAKTLKVVSQNRRTGSPMIVSKSVDVPQLKAEPVDVVTEQSLPEPVDLKTEMATQADIKPIVNDKVDENTSPEMRAWNAYKGDKLSIVLADWARQGNVKPNIDLVEEITLQKDIRVFGPLDIAVGQLLKDVYGDNAPTATLSESNKDKTTIQKGSHAELKNEISRWSAVQGMNLRKLLNRWSVGEGVDFVWDADQMFFLNETTKLEADYNSAVASVLAQYEGQDVKPVGSLNIDPETGRKTLIVKVSGGL